MAVSYYTSFETSRALREAGAPQEIPAGGGYWRDFGDVQHYVSRERRAASCFIRSMRLDEILEALDEAGDVALDNHREADPPMRWSVRHAIDCNSEVGYSSGPGLSPVEAAAACWLAVLRAAREAAR